MKKKKNKHAQALSKLATEGRKKIPPEVRSELATNAVNARWAKQKELKDNQEKDANLSTGE